VPWKDNNKKFVLTIGTCARTWEEVFYDLCHESLHLLNPVTDVKNKKISALEEGCAVSFAEAMYEKYISSYCNKVPTTSPTYDKSSQYFLAYFATKKIPDDVLKQVREVFGSFSTIDNVEKFTELVLPYASEEDIKILTTPFIYRK
jgi:hypothetical protein